MAGLFGIGGSGAKTDRKQQLQSWGELQSMFGPANTTGQQQLKAGTTGLSTASNYFGDIAKGGPAAARALAPQISAIQGQTGQAINTIGQFSGRSGGTAAAATQEGFAAQQAVQNLFDLLGPEAMKEVAAISGEQAAIGQGQEGLAADVAGTVGSQAGNARTTDQQLQQAQQAAVLEAISSLALA